MTVELAELAAGLPMAVSFALAGGIGGFREVRRRTALNEAMHELRRPLQTLSLAVPAGAGADPAVVSSLRQTAAALDRLDREINGTPPICPSTTIDIRLLLEEAAQRWKIPATLVAGRVRLRFGVEDAKVWGRRLEIEQALDNLISNALDHGGGEVTVGLDVERGSLLITVVDRGSVGGRERLRRRADRARHGHGLRVVRRVARSHGGSFEIRRSEDGAVASLRLPPAEEVGR